MGLAIDHPVFVDQISIREIVTYTSQSSGRDVPCELEGICFVGSGGKFSLASNKPLQTGGRISVEISTLGTADYMDEVQKVFGLSITQLAALFGTSRKTLYSWKSGGVDLRKNNSKRLFELLRVAKAWRESGFSPIGSSVEDKGSLEEMVFELLCEIEIDFEKVVFSGSRINILTNETSLVDPFS